MTTTSPLVPFFLHDPAPTEIYTLSLHDALPISLAERVGVRGSFRELDAWKVPHPASSSRSEEHTSELQSHSDLVCRLLLEKKKKERVRTAFIRLHLSVPSIGRPR